jgi:hypothetical protein
MKIGRGNQSSQRKPAPAPFCPPQIPLRQTRAQTRTATVGSQRLTAWATVRLTQPLSEMSTRNLPGGKAPGAYDWLPCRHLWAEYLKIWEPQPLATLRSSTACTGITLPFFFLLTLLYSNLQLKGAFLFKSVRNNLHREQIPFYPFIGLKNLQQTKITLRSLDWMQHKSYWFWIVTLPQRRLSGNIVIMKYTNKFVNNKGKIYDVF